MANLLNSLGSTGTLGYLAGSIYDMKTKTATVSMRDVIENNDLDKVVVSPTEFSKYNTMVRFRKGFYQNYNQAINMSDPTFLGFTIMFDDYNSPLFKGWNYNPTVFKEDNTLYEFQREKFPEGSALRYLETIGETKRITYLTEFITNLFYINANMPYFWQGIEGLDTTFEGMADFEKLPIVSEREFAIKTLESIDLKIYGLFELYRKAIYDYEYNRNVIPDNLLKFNCTIFINDMRNFNIFNDNLVFPLVDNLETGTVMELTSCKFKSKSGGGIFSSVSNVEMNKSENSIYFGAKGVSYKSVVPWFFDSIKDDITPIKEDMRKPDRIPSSYKGVNRRLQNLENYLKKIALNAIKTKADELIRKNLPPGLVGTLEELVAGNILGAFAQATGLVDSLRGGGGDMVYSPDEFHDTRAGINLGKVSDKVDVIDKPISLPNVFSTDVASTIVENPEKLDVYPQELGNVIGETPDLGDVYPIELGNVLNELPSNIDVYPEELGNVIGETPEELDVYPVELGNILVEKPDRVDVYPQELGNVLVEVPEKLDVYPQELGNVLVETPEKTDVYPEALGEVIGENQNLGKVYEENLNDVIDKPRTLSDVYAGEITSINIETPNVTNVFGKDVENIIAAGVDLGDVYTRELGDVIDRGQDLGSVYK